MTPTSTFRPFEHDHQRAGPEQKLNTGDSSVPIYGGPFNSVLHNYRHTQVSVSSVNLESLQKYHAQKCMGKICASAIK